MSNNYFNFKHFSVLQDRAAMKVGTDGVLLGAWAEMGPARLRVLDVGTGTGLIALMLAQRSELYGAAIDAIEIDGESALQAEVNIAASKWKERIRVVNISLQDFVRLNETHGLYDHIVSNPPYFLNSLLPPDDGRAQARHASSLSPEELISCGVSLLAPKGVISLIVPAQNEEMILNAALNNGLFPKRRLLVYSLPETPPKRVLMELSKEKNETEESRLVIEAGEPRDFTSEYRTLTKDFYLKF